jgi:S-adenosylmethionine:tRNA ribosyltransferase-isomerase
VDVSDFDYFLPDSSIAAYPATRRDGSRLLRLDRHAGAPVHAEFARLAAHLPERSLIVLNDTRVMPARLRGKKATGGAIELLLTRCMDDPRATAEPGRSQAGHPEAGRTMAWEALGRNLGWAAVGTELTFARGLVAEITRRGDAGAVEVRLRAPAGESVVELLEQVGQVPLPPYIEVARKRDAPSPAQGEDSAAFDRERYQTVFAREAGAVAAPTAGLHFTTELLAQLERAGHRIVRLTLHVGLGTFRPVKVAAIEDHQMEAETYTIPAETADAVNDARRAGRPVVAVGTTVVRALESSARASQEEEARKNGEDGGGPPAPGAAPGYRAVFAGTASSRLFLRPGSPFHVVTDLITNFHLPRSTLLMLVSAFAGRERILAAYAEAVAAGYRFYSYGDAMLIRGTP